MKVDSVNFISDKRSKTSLTIVDPFEFEVQLQDTLVERALETAIISRAVIPVFVDNLKAYITIGRACDESDDAGVLLDTGRD